MIRKDIAFCIIFFLNVCLSGFSQSGIELQGNLLIGSENVWSPMPGTLRFNHETHDFEGWNGYFWASLSGKQFETGTLNDCNGYEYLTVRIGNQEWMAENLRTSAYCNGSSIELITDDSLWLQSNSPAWCWYANDSLFGQDYGKLYNWYAMVDSQGICPGGWRIPKISDWQEMINFLGGSITTGQAIRAIGNEHWTPPNDDATNLSGFTCLPGGDRFVQFDGLGTKATFWSIEDAHPLSPTYLTYTRPNNFYWILGLDPNRGASIRCLRNN